MTKNPESNFNKSKFDAFMALADQRMKRRLERTQYEWKMSITLWAFLVGATYSVHPRPSDAILIPLLTAALIVHGWYISEVRKRNRLDTETTFYFLDHAENVLGVCEGCPRSRPNYEKAMAYSLRNVLGVWGQDFWWSGIQLAITVGLVLCAYRLMGSFDVHGH